jgi:type VI secretion system protein VasD
VKSKLWQGVLILILIRVAVSGCSKPPKVEPPPPPPPPTRITVNLQAAADLNPDPTGRPSPVVFRLYELKTPDTFNKADFFKLYEQDSAVLGGDLVARQEMLVKPGQTLQLERTLAAETQQLGLLAAYRDLDHAVWRTTLAIPPHQTTPVKVTLGRVTITAQAGK